VVEALGGDVEVVQVVGGRLQAIEEGERRGGGLRARVEDEVVGEGGLARLGEEVEDSGEEFVRRGVVVLEEAVWEGVTKGCC
jgi:hypothetical protein